MQRGLVGSEMCIRDSINAEYMGYKTMMSKDQLESFLEAVDKKFEKVYNFRFVQVTNYCRKLLGMKEKISVTDGRVKQMKSIMMTYLKKAPAFILYCVENKNPFKIIVNPRHRHKMVILSIAIGILLQKTKGASWIALIPSILISYPIILLLFCPEHFKMIASFSLKKL
eukprot:TRINITY_DN8049_c0_g1_i1.p1 TRINITY_DN8049_c0_g1~~TRINITY_DN8049_c0_g1_i1.p1  ORF type:complete len:169 (+),score=29.81 TRINITY_DN8049_c0_g1_i1:151-657(+)